MPLPKQVKASGREKEAILLYDPAETQKLADELSRKDTRQKAGSQSLQKLSASFLKALEPQATAALAAPVYAYFLRGSDIVVSEDPLLLRKHRYLDFASDGARERILEAEFVSNNEGTGSYLQGSFVQFALASAHAAAVGWKQGGNGGNAVIPAQIAAIRSTHWKQLRASDQRLASLRILAAREWIVEAAENSSKLQSLSVETMGLIFAAPCVGLDFDPVRLIISPMHTKGAPRPRKGTIPPLLFCCITTHSLLARRSGSRAPKKE